MAVAFDVASESHTSTTGSTAQASFTWNHVGGASARGALVFVFSALNATHYVTSVTYGGVTMTAVPYDASTASAEAGTCRAYYLDNCGTGTKAVVVNRTNNATIMYAVCNTVTAAAATEVYLPGVMTQGGATSNTAASSSGSTSTAAAGLKSVDDGSPGSDSQRFMGQYVGAAAPLAAGTGSTAGPSIDFGAYGIAAYHETTPGQGARNVGSASGTDDLALVALAVRETPAANVTVVPGPAGGAGADYAATCAADSPLAAWRMGEASGLIQDVTAAHHATTVGGTPTYAQAGGIAGDSDTAILFDGATEYFSASCAGFPSGAAARSIEAWVNTTSASTAGDVFGYGTSAANSAIIMRLNNGALQLLVRNSAGTGYDTFAFGGDVNDGAWHHIAITWDGTTAYGYVDGSQVGTGQTPTINTSLTSSSWELGVRSGFFGGTLDELAIYAAALTSTRVAAHYAVGHDGPSAGGIVLTGAVPTVTVAAPANIVATPTAASLVATGAVPSVVALAPQVALPTAASLVATGATPAVAAPRVSLPTAASFVLTGATPSVIALAPQVSLPTAASMTATGAVPTVTAIGTSHPIPTAASLIATGAVPTVVAIGTALAMPTAAAMTATGVTPTVTVSAAGIYQPAAASMALSGSTPAILLPVVTQPGLVALTTSLGTPAVLSPRVAVPGSVSLAASGATLTVRVSIISLPTGASISTSLGTPAIALSIFSRPTAASLAATGAVPSVTATSGLVVAPSAASLAMTAFAPDMVLTDNWTFAPGAAALTLAMFAPTVTATAAALAGRTLDQHGDPIGSCTVDAFTSATNVFYGTATSDSAGRYSIAVLPGVPYFLVAYKGDEVFGASARDLIA